jgi:16S rRNA (guanine1207-N2)-methyltransferase
MNDTTPNSIYDEKLPPYPQEELLIGAIPSLSAERVVCTSAGLAQFAVAAARALPNAEVSCTYLDLYRANLAISYWNELPPNLRIECAADLPDKEADVFALPFSASGEAELARELIQAGHERLRMGGQMLITTDNPNDTWLRYQLSELFRKLDRRESPIGALYTGTKTEPLKRKRNFACEFAFRDRGRLLRAFSRPAVFSHRRVDPGARHLINEMQIEPGSRILDIGCGAGVVALVAAQRAAGTQVHAVDSNTRAIQCTQRGAELNELHNVTVELNAAGGYANAGTYDLALANPPYYSNFRIAEHFLRAAHESLRPGGKVLIVTKRADWYLENMPDWFDGVKVNERKRYYVIEGIRPADGAKIARPSNLI